MLKREIALPATPPGAQSEDALRPQRPMPNSLCHIRVTA
jgi:hypothetical protein